MPPDSLNSTYSLVLKSHIRGTIYHAKDIGYRGDFVMFCIKQTDREQEFV